MQNYEVSSKGDKRFSAFYARIRGNGYSGRSIEDIYQTDTKAALGGTEFTGKGKVNPNVPYEQYYAEYKKLWLQHYVENPAIWQELANTVGDRANITDMFASSPVSQARAVSEILNEFYGKHTTHSRYPKN